MYTYDLSLYMLEKLNNRVCNQHIDKVVIATRVISTVYKLKGIKRYLLNLAIL